MSEELQTVQMLVRRLKEGGQRDAVRALDRDDLHRWDYQAVAELAQQLSAGLVEAGVDRGERVALFAPNSAEWVVACLAILDAGAVVTPLDTQMPRAELTHALADSGARRIFTGGEAARRLEGLELGHSLEMIRLDEPAGSGRSWRDWLREDGPAAPEITPADPATLFYTSGTTGMPKGVPLTHGNITANLNALLGQELAQRDDRIFVPLPYHHVYPFTLGLITPLALGASIVLPYSVLGPQIVRALREGDATIILGVPRLYEALDGAIRGRVAERGARAERLFEGMLRLSRTARHRLGWPLGRRLFRSLHQRMAPSVRMVVAGGAPLNPEIGERLRDLGWEVATGYGLTETSPILTYNPPDRLRLKAAGLPLPGVELRIDPVEEGARTGEVLARGQNVFQGYWHLPEKSAEVFTPDGFYRTGDLGWFDEEGYLHLEGRASEMIVLAGGENVDPERVEGALSAAEAVRDAGVLEHEGRLAAVLFPDPQAVRDLDDEQVRQRLNQALHEAAGVLPSHHQISTYRVSSDPLPRTRLGKLRRHKLRELFEMLGEGAKAAETGPMPEERMAVEDQQLLQIPTARRVWEGLVRRYPRVRLTPDSNLRLDLGLDSLGWVDLTLELRGSVGVALEEEALGRIETVRDLLREAAEAAEISPDESRGPGLVEQLRDPEAMLSDQQLRWMLPRTRFERLLGAIFYGIDQVLFRAYAPVRVEGLENLPERDPVLLVPNHLSAVDPPALGSIMRYARIVRMRWGGWTGLLFSNRLVRLVSRACLVLPIDPHTGPRGSLALGAKALRDGYGLVWFPEGRRSADGSLQAFQPGVGLLLQAQSVPAIPVWIEGTDRVMPIGTRLLRPGRITIRLGEPVSAETLDAEGEGETPELRIAAALEQRVRRLGQAEPGQAE
ncbi:MAG: AMP-binding protein [Halorhodospira halophila]|uniref:AMP-binding protein n=2 Tax=Halorhodospira halophila TaxID=1053 RepID=UPI001914B5D1|nr:AMP-binding protein [Halorhodospira halophila]MBK5936921.1 AMP-dependent synthetase [Halorhodospira halophila]MCC3750707.1 AMP-binding protein [Halorhodospira halophila]